MRSKSNKPWDIYAGQLMEKGYGYPLWTPDQPRLRGVFKDSSLPVKTAKGRGVIVGDVGYLRRGEFYLLFNAFEPSNSPAQPHGKVPKGFIPLSTDGLVFSEPRETIRQRKICNGFTHDRGVSGDGKTGHSDIGATVKLSFRATSSAGAVLMPHPSIQAHDIQSLLALEEYMAPNFTSWVVFAKEELKIALEPEDIHFVFGTKKTARWMVAAYEGTHYRNKSGSIAAALGLGSSLGLSMQIKDTEMEHQYFNHGPSDRDPMDLASIREMFRMPIDSPAQSAHWAEASLPHPRPNTTPGSGEYHDQCLFFHSLRFKRRSPLVALGTGITHKLATSVPDDKELISRHKRKWTARAISGLSGFLSAFLSAIRTRLLSIFKRFTSSAKGAQLQALPEMEKMAIDPVEDLLDYILRERPDATSAVASTLLVDVLLAHDEWPEYFEEAFEKLQPRIHVDDKGVGRIVCDASVVARYAWAPNRRRDEECWSAPFVIPHSDLEGRSPIDGARRARRRSWGSFAPGLRTLGSLNKESEAAPETRDVPVVLYDESSRRRSASISRRMSVFA